MPGRLPGRLHKMFLCTRLRREDFLRIPAKQRIPDETARHSHPGSKRAFRNIPVPKFLFLKRNPKKIRIDSIGQRQKHLVQSAGQFALFHSVKRLLTP